MKVVFEFPSGKKCCKAKGVFHAGTPESVLSDTWSRPTPRFGVVALAIAAPHRVPQGKLRRVTGWAGSTSY